MTAPSDAPAPLDIAWCQLQGKRTGGDVYERMARAALSERYNLDFQPLDAVFGKRVRVLRVPETLYRLSRIRGRRDVWIRDFFSAVAMDRERTIGRNMVMIHHIDFSTLPAWSRPVFSMMERAFYRKLRQVEAIVTECDYWRDHFLRLGFQRVHKIYNCFDLADFEIDERDIPEFRRRYALTGKPIVYLGNCQAAKGVGEAFEALKSEDYHLVTSGTPQVKIGARNLDLEYKDYLRLLKASSVVVTMSKFKEGWCRTAHEAMLFKTPVIGSGEGGMAELLEGGGQIICRDFGDLPAKVRFALEHPLLGDAGYAYAKDFTHVRFSKEWVDLVRRVATEA
ncbi:MAG: group 1 glycosyl transferase [Elusimicrobia bacterium]|nr:group 1 glycosyl transferase [Elusimicrobiota bacterium]